MKDLKPIIAKNITALRQAAQMTQSDLAERLNYSDKAVSKWERGESVPDVMVLKEIGDLFGVTVDYLLTEDHEGDAAPVMPVQTPLYRHSRGIITTLAVLLVWFIALSAFVVMDSIPAVTKLQWLPFVYATPVSMIVWLVLNSIWFNTRWNYLIISFLMWSVLLSLAVTLWAVNIPVWNVLTLGILGQIGIILWSRMRIRNTKQEK